MEELRNEFGENTKSLVRKWNEEYLQYMESHGAGKVVNGQLHVNPDMYEKIHKGYTTYIAGLEVSAKRHKDLKHARTKDKEDRIKNEQLPLSKGDAKPAPKDNTRTESRPKGTPRPSDGGGDTDTDDTSPVGQIIW